ncbi:hypothetical protein LptCag_1680 [Leptospirillum ferriphilum]|uniref:Uncharacterized protein n=1 Tax=Leptospirillum ferriphilum TaxID=178606 RepID=A0A094YI17_9BACT|nr:hypothetical protein LptCag_1680 [Leptospirillum ferriphilum]OOH73578.1 hypothetical protein BOX24_03615 [Leptospirillum ferriphilum]
MSISVSSLPSIFRQLEKNVRERRHRRRKDWTILFFQRLFPCPGPAMAPDLPNVGIRRKSRTSGREHVLCDRVCQTVLFRE